MKIVCCLGDSHTNIFEHIHHYYPWWHTRFEITVVKGATALGLVNPNSRTQAFQVFDLVINQAKRKTSFLFCMGEVDCGFVIWYRAEKNQVPIENQISKSFTNYSNYIDSVRRRGFSDIIIYSVPLPIIDESLDWGESSNLRKEVKATKRDRTD